MVGDAKILFLATHDADLIRSNCNKILRLDHGKVASIEQI
jgi:ABC-type polysaccharide/polyol phosphate transport system ATPase subunit